MEDKPDHKHLPLLESNESCVEGTVYLIQEVTGYTSEVLNEGVERRGGLTRFSGLFQHAGIRNKNGRTYAESILRPEIDRLIPIARERGLVGELDHPTDAIIHLADASHVNLEFKWDGDKIFGTGEVLPTPAGRVLDSLFEARIKVGISSRGIGGGKFRDGALHICEGYRCVTFDTVADPSTPEAYQEVCEALDLGKRAGSNVVSLAEAIADGDLERAEAMTVESGVPSESAHGVVSRGKKREVAPVLMAALKILAARR